MSQELEGLSSADFALKIVSYAKEAYGLDVSYQVLPGKYVVFKVDRFMRKVSLKEKVGKILYELDLFFTTCAIRKLVAKSFEVAELNGVSEFEHVEQLCYHIGLVLRDLRHRIEKETKIPKWAKDLQKRLIKEGYVYGLYNPAWIDHAYFNEKGELVSEPYSRSMDNFKELIAFCEANNLTFHVTGTSKWFPGKTFRIIIKPRGDS